MTYQAEAESLLRQRQLAEAMQQQYSKPMSSGQMAGRYFARTSPLQYLAQALKENIAANNASKADEQLKALGAQREERKGADMSLLAQALSGRQAQPAGMMEDASGNVTPTDPIAAQTPVQSLAGVLPMLGPDTQGLGFQALQGAQTRADTQAFQEKQMQAQQAARSHEAELARQAQAEQARLARESREGIARDNQANQLGIQQMLLDARPAPQQPQPRIVQTEQGPMQIGADNRAVPIIGPDGKPIKAPPKSAMPLSATAQKELFEADDVANSATNAIGILRSIITPDPKTKKSQNDMAFEGGTAGLRQKVMGFVPGSYEGENASVDLQNKVTGQALEQLKVIFGGMPTEGERKILLELQGSINMKADQRKKIFERAIALAERRLTTAQDKAKRLREGTYFGAGVATNQDGSQGGWSITPVGQ